MLVINSSDDLLEVLREAFADEGLRTETAHVADLKREPARIAPLLQHVRPRCIVFDIAPLYDDNWRWFRDVFCTHPDVAGLPIVVTTTNLAALRSFGIDATVHEIVGKPYDINRILHAVEGALGRYSASPSAGGRPA